jgi:radical SAM protein with 4Fe4S-binding SPASM domain
MSLELFKNVVDEAVEGGTKAITLASRGEPTMNKNLGKMLEYTKDKFFEVKLNTNGTKMTEKLCHEILSSGVTELVWSIDAPKKELYEKIRLKGKFDVVIKNIKMFNDIREKHYPDSILKTTAGGVMFHEEQDIQEFTNFFNNLADNVTAQTIENRWNTYENEVTPEIDSPCEYLWERMYVWFDGKCNPCDVDYKSALKVGDIGNNSIKEIWHGEIYQKLRDDHKKKERKKWSPCDRCGIG